MTITEFLESRIAEDEEFICAPDEFDTGLFHCPQDPHAAMGYERLAAECATKRAILDAVEPGQWYSNPGHSGYADAMDIVLHSLAIVYRDHPDYQQEWAA